MILSEARERCRQEGVGAIRSRRRVLSTAGSGVLRACLHHCSKAPNQEEPDEPFRHTRLLLDAENKRGRRRKAIRFMDRSNEVPVPDSLACSLQGTSLYTFRGLNSPSWACCSRNTTRVT